MTAVQLAAADSIDSSADGGRRSAAERRAQARTPCLCGSQEAKVRLHWQGKARSAPAAAAGADKLLVLQRQSGRRCGSCGKRGATWPSSASAHAPLAGNRPGAASDSIHGQCCFVWGWHVLVYGPSASLAGCWSSLRMLAGGDARAARARYSEKIGFRERSETPEIALELSLQPWRAFRPDGVIMFSDILTPLPALGIEFDVVRGKGPVIASPVRRCAPPVSRPVLTGTRAGSAHIPGLACMSHR